MARVLLATRSAGKLRELRPLFERAGLDVVDLNELGLRETAIEDDLEQFETFEENALAKAAFFHEMTGIPAVADDSGLSVVALGGRPGVRSKRWTGRQDLAGQALDDENNRSLLQALRNVSDRRAYYVCVAAFVDGEIAIARRGESSGRITKIARGRGGFGYDPYFFSNELGVTFAEATLEEKERVSHRGRAFRLLLDEIKAMRD